MKFTRKQKVYDGASLYEAAVRLLGRKMRTVAELKRTLRVRVANQENGEALIEGVILKLKEQRYLNDTNYATAYSNYRRENEKFGKRRVVSDLKAKGVHQDVIEKTVGEAYSGINEESLARDFLNRKRFRKPSNEKEAARVFRAMVRAGFGSRTIFQILKNWDIDDEVISTLETEALDSPEGS